MYEDASGLAERTFARNSRLRSQAAELAADAGMRLMQALSSHLDEPARGPGA